MLNNTQIAYLKIIIAMFFWGGAYHAAKFVVVDLDPYTSSAVRWGIAAIILVCMLFKQKSFSGFMQPLRFWPLIIAIGFFAICLYNLFFFAAEAILPANLVAIIISFTPCITVIFSRVFFKEPLNLLTIIGVLTAFLGAVFAINLSQSGCGHIWCSNLLHNLNYGELMAFMTAIGSAVYSLLLKKSAKMGMDGLTITALSSTVGAIFLIIIAAFKGNYLALFSLSLHTWWLMLYLAVFASVIGYKWYSDGVKELKVSQAVIFINTIPLASIIVGILFFNTQVGMLFFLSAIMVVIGVIITNYSLTRV
ncbi:MAG: cytochrome [Burkholderiales bacterium]|jgi:drug/metabolite transporter (DMT)-like permease|nr:cytochrome [Burkholderiales bacterium]